MKLDKLKRTIKEGIRDMSIIWANEMKMTVKDEAVLIFFQVMRQFWASR